MCRPACLVAFLVLTVLLANGAARAQWARTHGGPGAGEFVHAVREMPGGDIVVAASTDSFGTATGDGWLIRLDSAGNVLSESCAGAASPGGVDGAVVMPDGGAVFSSRMVFDPFLHHETIVTRVASDGTVQWNTRFASDPGRYFLNDLVDTPDGGVLGVGQASQQDFGPFVGWLVKLDATGRVTWQQYWGGALGVDVSFDAVVATGDGGYALTGWATGGPGGTDVLVAKADSNGALAWTQQLGGDQDDRGESIVEVRGDGGYAVAGSTNSFTPSGHSAWIVRLDGTGMVTWTAALGQDDWMDLQSITQTADQQLVVLGRLSAATNDLWAAKVEQGTAAVLWQRRYQGDSGDYGAEVVELASGDLLMAGTWGWGFPEEDLWTLRTDPEGRLGGCAIVADTAVTTIAPRYGSSSPLLPPFPPLATVRPGSVVPGTSALTSATQCSASACPPFSCDAVAVVPDPACEGTEQGLSLTTSGGTGMVTVVWDLTGDGNPDATGSPLLVTLTPGTHRVTATATDECAPVPQQCSLALDVEVLPALPPGEVSDVLAGAVPLLVSDHAARVSFEDRGDARAYNLYADAIGSWYAPGAPAGSACFVTTSPAGPGRLETAPALADDTWFVVTASSRCAEGSAGRDSFDVQRRSVGTWTECGPAP